MVVACMFRCARDGGVVGGEALLWDILSPASCSVSGNRAVTCTAEERGSGGGTAEESRMERDPREAASVNEAIEVRGAWRETRERPPIDNLDFNEIGEGEESRMEGGRPDPGARGAIIKARLSHP